MQFAFKNLILGASLVFSSFAFADRVATQNSALFDMVVSSVTTCQNCKRMDELRQFYQAAHRDVRKRKQAVAKLTKVHAFGDRLKSLDQRELRDAYYNDEVRAFMALAADALPYDQETEVARDIAYLNLEIGTSEHWQKIAASQPESCRKQFITEAVKTYECEEANARAEAEAEESGTSRKLKLKTCAPLTFNVDTCEAKKINARPSVGG